MRVQGHTVLGPFDTAEEAAEGLVNFLRGLMVPPSGVEPELPKETDFESVASANSAKEAYPVGEGVSPMGMADTHWQMGAGKSTDQGKPGVKTSGHIPNLMVRTLAEIKLPFGWGLEVRAVETISPTWTSPVAAEYQVRITCGATVDNMTGEHMEGWNGRWWRLSKHMTAGEIVQTVFKATMTALEHEAREMFLYKGVPVLDPHYDIDKLVEFRKDPASILGRS
jgi:hypothetical protein